jgi:hypothetical protein
LTVLVDHAAQARLACVLARDHDGHVVVEDLDREVLPHLAEDLLLLLLDDLAGTVMRVDDVVADLERDALRLAGDVQVLDLLGLDLGDGVLLHRLSPGCRASMDLCVMSAGSGQRG